MVGCSLGGCSESGCSLPGCLLAELAGWLAGCLAAEAWRATKTNSDPEHHKSIIKVSWEVVPLDHLMMQLQYLDAQGASLMEVIDVRRSPFAEAQNSFVAMLAQAPAVGPLRALFYHFETSEWAAVDIIAEVRNDIMSMAAQLWIRFELVFEDYPYLFVRFAHAEFDSLQLADDFFAFAVCRCCVGRFGLKVLKMYPTAAELAKCKHFKHAMYNWKANATIVNMHLERLLALIKKATPCKAPYVDRSCAAGTLTQWLRRHVTQLGGGRSTG